MSSERVSVMRCPVCQKLILGEELIRKDGHSFVKPDHNGSFWQTVYGYCICGNPIALTFDPGDGTGETANEGVEEIEVGLRLD